MREYLAEIQLICDSLAGCAHPIVEMQQISIILNGVKGQYDSIISVIHASRNPYHLAYISLVLLDVEARQKVIMFDNSISVANIVVKPVSDAQTTTSIGILDSGQSWPTNTGQQ